jgi:hypothetical protein
MNSDPVDRSIPRLTFRNLSGIPGLAHAVFTRQGGVSKPPYDSLNTSWSNGDSPEAVQENLARIKEAVGLEWLVSGHQFHGDTLNFISRESVRDLHRRAPLLITPAADALATNLPGLGLVIKIADCQSILLADPHSRIIANIHSGWRGSVLNIAGKTVRHLQERFGLDPAQTLAAVSPSLGPCCAEFVNYRKEIPESLWPYQVRPDHFDFWAMTKEQLTSAGIRESNIEFAEKCTVCGKADFFSYRGARGSTGRMATVIGWE